MEEFKRVLKFMFYILDNLSNNSEMLILQGECNGDIVLDVKGCQIFMRNNCEFLVKFDQQIHRPEPCLLLTYMKDARYPIEARKAASMDIRKVVKCIEDFCYMNYASSTNVALLQLSHRVRERLDAVDKSIYVREDFSS